MSKAPAMPMYWDAYLADTTHLTTEEHGAYLLLLAAMWRRNGSVPDSDRDNARILGLTPAKWRKVRARFIETISGFTVEGGFITQEKLQKTWKNTQEIIQKNRQNGSKGGRPKLNENSALVKANGSVSVNPNKTIPEPEPEPEEKRDTVVSPKKESEPGFELVPSQQIQKPEKPKRKTRIPENAVISESQVRIAAEEGHSVEEARAQFERFKSSNVASGRSYVNWDAAWRNWFRSPYFKPITGGSNGKGSHTEDERMRTIARIAGLV